MEFILLGLVFFLAFGGWRWCRDCFDDTRHATRDFLSKHAVAYRLASCVALLSGATLAVSLSLDMPDGKVLGFIAIGLIVTVITLPIWFLTLLMVGFFYETFIAPTLGMIVYLLRPLHASIEVVATPVRRRGESLRQNRRRAEEEQETRNQQGDQKRRENARARCDVMYHLHAPEIGERFPRRTFDDYMEKYMHDRLEPEQVEVRGSLLETLLREHVDRVQPPQTFRTLEDIARWFEEQKQELNKLPDERLRKTLLVTLRERYMELTTEFLEEMQA
jgi:hypothetical protein